MSSYIIIDIILYEINNSCHCTFCQVVILCFKTGQFLVILFFIKLLQECYFWRFYISPLFNHFLKKVYFPITFGFIYRNVYFDISSILSLPQQNDLMMRLEVIRENAVNYLSNSLHFLLYLNKCNIFWSSNLIGVTRKNMSFHLISKFPLQFANPEGI